MFARRLAVFATLVLLCTLVSCVTNQTAGVDFSNIPLNIVKARVTSGGGGRPLEFVVRARKITATPSGKPDYQTYSLRNPFMPLNPADVSKELIDSFFVWLSLDAHRFWVNLKPHEKHLIMDRELAQTYAGRVLLEADLLLKRSVGDIMHPDGELGMLFWDNFYDNAEELFDSLSDLCFSFRQWVVPGDVALVESDDTLFVLRALLDVKLESEYAQGRTVQHRGQLIAGGCPPGSDPRVQTLAEHLFRALVLPELIRRVNSAPEYAPLRSVYYMRVLAEWYRQQAHASGSTAPFRDIIESNDARRWWSDEQWDPLSVWNDYVRSVTQGEFDLVRHFLVEGDIISRSFFYGGIDLTDIIGVSARPVCSRAHNATAASPFPLSVGVSVHARSSAQSVSRDRPRADM